MNDDRTDPSRSAFQSPVVAISSTARSTMASAA